MNNDNREEYKKLLTQDYQIVRVHPTTGEVCTKTITPWTDDPTFDFNESFLHELTWLIGHFTIYGFTPLRLYWSYKLKRGEYMGGGYYDSIDKLVDLYHWFSQEAF